MYIEKEAPKHHPKVYREVYIGRPMAHPKRERGRNKKHHLPSLRT